MRKTEEKNNIYQYGYHKRLFICLVLIYTEKKPINRLFLYNKIHFPSYYQWHLYKISNNFTFEVHANISYFQKWQNDIIKFDCFFLLREVKMRYATRNEQIEREKKTSSPCLPIFSPKNRTIILI